ncbi:hypothetical protein [Methylobacterium sp. P1-11]|uniref:hypothetical protein n=1 Tax=Methylobacterium sp. P1-11 TaxID=2024616 RepID=UPI0011ECACDB|nr:hypothetical protein [Methylobacterium sp. P1-11]
MASGESEGFNGASGKAPMMKLTWFVGMLSTAYLVWNTLLLSLLSIAFMDYSTPGFEWSKVPDVGRYSAPLCVSVALGFAGLKFWPRGRFRFLGLTAILTQTAMAVCAFASPVGVLIFIDWLG